MKQWLLLLLLVVLSNPAFAHKESNAYLTLRTDPERPSVLHGQFDVALRDLAFVLDIDADHNSALTWGEVKARRSDIERFVLGAITLKGDGPACDLRPTDQKITTHNDGAYDVVFFEATCDTDITDRATVAYDLFEGVDPYHRGIVTVHAGRVVAGAVLGPARPNVTLELGQADHWSRFRHFLVDGVWHIWTGADHLLFIFALLLPAVLRRQSSGMGEGVAGTRACSGLPETGWVPVPRLSAAILELIKVITGFTVSHSLALILAILGYVDLPSRLVESGIALSIIVAALHNLFPIVTRRAWLIAFAFGFVHGLGFASALAGLSLPPAAMAASLGGFSLGVELGQEAIVLPFLALAFLLRKTRFYQVGVVRGGSLLIIAIATLWLVQRAFDVVVPGTALLTPG